MTHCGFIALIGRPNVGKSTLLNRLIGEKVSITARKPQTTRHRIFGVHSIEETQFIYVDTPGIHRGYKSKLNQYMNRAAWQTLRDVDVILFMIDRPHWLAEDEFILDKLRKIDTPIILVINKTDKISNKNQLLPFIVDAKARCDFKEFFPLSAKTGENVAVLEQTIKQFLPENPFYFPVEQITDKNIKFRAAECVREKLVRLIGDELPYQCTVQIEKLKSIKKVYHADVLIWVERAGQKKIIIGKDGEKLKQVGTQSRHALEALLGKKVFLRLWVKVRQGWSDDKQALFEFGYEQD